MVNRCDVAPSTQVLEWTHTILGAGEAFCGSESATLRDALRRQSGRFFAAFHSANLQARTSSCNTFSPLRSSCLNTHPAPDLEAAANQGSSEPGCCLTSASSCMAKLHW